MIRKNSRLDSNYTRLDGTRKYSFVCPKCFRMYEMNIQIGPMNFLNFDNIDIHDNMKLQYICQECSSIESKICCFQVDNNIADSISIINRKSYTTADSCEGHIDITSGKTTEPYVIFGKDIIIPTSLPEMWYMDYITLNNIKFIKISVKEFFKNCDEYTLEDLFKMKKDYLLNLNEWAYQL